LPHRTTLGWWTQCERPTYAMWAAGLFVPGSLFVAIRGERR
jgi:hypothetical protein